MNSKILNFMLIATSLLGYLEWSGDSSAYLFEAEAEIFSKLFTDPQSVLHPFTVIPLIAQLLLVFTLFQKHPSKVLTYTSIVGLGFLLGFILVIGLLAMNFKIVGSTVPFFAIAVITILHYRRLKQEK